MTRRARNVLGGSTPRSDPLISDDEWGQVSGRGPDDGMIFFFPSAPATHRPAVLEDIPAEGARCRDPEREPAKDCAIPASMPGVRPPSETQPASSASDAAVARSRRRLRRTATSWSAESGYSNTTAASPT